MSSLSVHHVQVSQACTADLFGVRAAVTWLEGPLDAEAGAPPGLKLGAGLVAGEGWLDSSPVPCRLGLLLALALRLHPQVCPSSVACVPLMYAGLKVLGLLV
jgi:hypothetical protein